MVQNYFLKALLFLLFLCLFGNTVGEGFTSKNYRFLEVITVDSSQTVSRNYRFKIFSEDFLDSTSVKSDTSDLLGEFKLDQNFNRPKNDLITSFTSSKV